jgi:hypothetical protein
MQAINDRLCAPSGDSMVIAQPCRELRVCDVSRMILPRSHKGCMPWSRQHCQEAKDVQPALFPENGRTVNWRSAVRCRLGLH